ncbi:DMSO/TMAO reductase YedYZ molybdopterin-dependent catalytic subunit [Novosphingobium chloroacetimidivorans]|uniref:DMSO/TMAO reductase YedYZ molybdopterin-dependent catalytic subunit n=1 Tax=Novosphingobium chloroacetimidivorans TaxID=1428314 RepID=A0A7W7NV79_9SPHN|nr:molybdopterin-dependent oxidoreductase [Novosphingobium chloroacetimidivorans]MBB4858293.1 DMSO/TMAO reductase YedYZ molybdopterin-dependent catalytic subunit [Novosphingobium chloroacetimidivorans]
MDRLDPLLARTLARRRLLATGALGLAAGGTALAQSGKVAQLLMAGGPEQRPLTSVFPGKGEMILQRNRPPLLETPMSVFDQGVFTPNDRFFVRWHWSDIPLDVDAEAFRLTITGGKQPVSLSLPEILKLPRISYAAVNQCSGNSRGLFDPRVPGAQWAHGAMGNAIWEGVALKTLLDKAGIDPKAAAVRFGGLDKPLTQVDAFEKSLALDHAMDGEVMVAFAMNGEQLPLLNGFPLRLIVPGWYSTYWVKSLNHIDLLAGKDTNYWMAKAYQIPDTPNADVPPGTTEFPKTPISAMNVRSWITSTEPGAKVPIAASLPVRGVAMGGDTGVKRVEVSADGGKSWHDAKLGPDQGRYGFRRFETQVAIAARGPVRLMSRCTSSSGQVQPMKANWNPGGYMRNCVEPCPIEIV